MTRCPYPGLRPFDQSDTEFFFGRDRQISELIARLKTQRFVGVVGFSGSGKSSLVLAGLLPALRAGQLGPSDRWRIAILRPSPNPVATLAGALDQALGAWPERERKLEASTFGLLEGTTEGRGKEVNLLIVVDQFEDLFRLVEEGKLDAQHAAHFINLLLTVAEEARLEFAVYVVATMRSEYLGHCARFYGLPETLNRCQYLVPRLTPEQLREVIETPAAAMGVEMEPALVQRLLVDASVAVDELPRLQHLLARLWERREQTEEGAMIRLAHYRLPEIDGLEHALDLHAEEVYGALSERERWVAERVFQRLTMWSEATRDARRPTGRAELVAVTGAPLEEVEVVVEAFRKANFFTEIPASAGGESLVDITHESLIRQWERLKSWARKEARAAEIYRSLAGSAATGERLLWSNAAVQEAVEWRETQHPTEVWADRYWPGLLGGALGVLGQLEEDFHAAERLRQSERDLKADARRKRRMIVGLVGLMLVLVGLSGWALRERARAERNTETARDSERVAVGERLRANREAKEAKRSRELAENSAATAMASAESAVTLRLAAESVSLMPTGAYATAALLAIESMRLRAVPQNLAALWRATVPLARQRWSVTGKGAVSAVAVSPDGKRVLSAGADGVVRVIDAASGKVARTVDLNGPVNGVAFSPDGRWSAIASEKTARVIDLATGRELSHHDQSGVIHAVAFTPDGKRVATGGDAFMGGSGGNFQMFQASTGETVPTLFDQTPISLIAFSPTGKQVAVAALGSFGAGVRVLGVEPWAELRLLDQTGVATSVVFSPDGKGIATGGNDKTARVIDVATGKVVASLSHQDVVRAVAFSPDGRWVATGSADNTLRLMEASTGKEAARFAQLAGVNAVAFSPDGKWLIAGGDDNAVRMLEIADSRVTRFPHESDLRAVTMDPTGRRLATASGYPVSFQCLTRVMEATTGTEVARSLVLHVTPSTIALSGDAQWVATGGGIELNEGGYVEVTDVTGRNKYPRIDLSGTLTSAALSADAKWIAVGSEQSGRLAGYSEIRGVEPATGELVWRLEDKGVFKALAFSSNGKWLGIGSEDGAARVMDPVSGKEGSMLKHEGAVVALVFSPDSRLLATASADRTARLMDLATGKELARLGHQGAVRAVAFSADGKRIVSGSDDKTARVMDASSGKEVLRYQMADPVVGVAFPGPSMLEVVVRTTQTDLTLYRISLDPDVLVREACSRLPRNLTREEWERYLPGEPYRKTCANLP